jgi:[acyl-carrier-protein] S-malonyltransferase
MKTAWVFPGQGSQAIGMGSDLKDTAIAQTKLSQAEQILGWSILDLCQGDEETLSRTLYTQPCLYVIEAILADLLREKGENPELVAGHSLGEYVALYSARVFDFEAGLKLVKRRAELMDSAAGGKMAALMKFDRDQLQTVIEKTPDVVFANDNSDQQVVISGTPEAVDLVLSQVKAKRAIPLKVSGAFHSPLMSYAAKQFQEALETVSFNDPEIPVLSNIDPLPSTSATELKERLVKQMTGAVRWREIMLQIPLEGVTNIVEVGPGKVLSGLIKRACPDLEVKNIGTLADL